MTTENASGLLPEGQDLPADTTQQPATGAEGQEPQQEAKTFTQQELDEKVQRRVAKAERKAQAQIQELREQIEALKTSPRPADNQDTSKEPQRSEFSSYEDYVEAKAIFKAEQAAEKRLQAEREARERETQKTRQEESGKEFRRRVEAVIEKGNEKFADFDAVINEAVEDGVIAIDSPMYHGLIDSDMGHEIAYWLAKNPKEAQRIAGLSAYRQVAEIGKLEDRLAAKQKQRETIDPISSRGNPINGLRDDLSTDAWMKARNKQLRDQRG